MGNKKYSGSAFPSVYPYGDYEEGMTLRDYFAGKALPEIIRAFLNGEDSIINSIKKSDDKAASYISGVAYEFADAMINEREK